MQLELLNDQGQASPVKAPALKKTVNKFTTQPRSHSSKKAPVVHVLV